MNLFQFQLCYHSFLIFMRVIILITIGFWAKNSFDYFQINNITEYFQDLSILEKSLDQIWAICKPWLIDTGWFMAKIMVLEMIVWGTKRIPIFPKWYAHWDSIGDIKPILGRLITEYLRNNYSLNMMDFIYYIKQSKRESAILNHHLKNEHLYHFFKKHDPYFAKDAEVQPEKKEKPKVEEKKEPTFTAKPIKIEPTEAEK